ncbi:ABC transporter permease subunit, partial [Romeria aff. gracilis LEGE 07310]
GLAVPRAIHELIWGLFLINILGLDPLVAVLAIAIPFGAITAKVFSEILDETPQEPLQALRHSGVPPLTAFLYAHLPQALPNLLSYMFYRFECALRASAVLGVIGAGGLGYEISLSLQSLRYEQLWTGFYALILLNGAVDTWSATLRRQMGFTSRLDLNYGSPNPSGRTIQSPSPRGEGFRERASRAVTKRRIRPLVWASWLGIAVAVPLCFSYLQLDWSRLWAGRTRSLLAEILTQVSPSQVLPEFSGALPSLALQTLAMSILAMTLASIGGILFSFPAAQNVWLPGGLLRPMGETSRGLALSHLWLAASRLLLLVARAIPAPIWALVILYGVFPSLLPGALALALHNFGILGRLMAEVNENLPDAPIRALRSLGAGSGGLIFYGILPQNLPRFLAYSLYRWEVCMRETVIVGLVGAGGLGRLMAEQISSFDYGGLAATLTVFIGLTFAVDLISAAMRRDFR